MIEFIKKNVLFIIFFIALIVAKLLWNVSFFSDGILLITAFIILWYTWETHQIREAESIIAKESKERIRKQQTPIIGYEIFKSNSKPHDTGFRIINLSDHPVAVQVNCNFKINEKPITNYSPAYDGKHFWNLQYRQTKEGHFSILDLFLVMNLIPQEKIREIIQNKPYEIREKLIGWIIFKFNMELPNLTMDIEINCHNDFGKSSKYPPTHYDFNFDRLEWIPIITSDKPYWKYVLKSS